MLSNSETRPSYSEADWDPDLSFAKSNRDRDIFMFVSNRENFGHLVNPDNFNVSYTNPEMYQLFDNKFDWEKRYIHENYSKNFLEGNTPIQVPEYTFSPISMYLIRNNYFLQLFPNKMPR